MFWTFCMANPAAAVFILCFALFMIAIGWSDLCKVLIAWAPKNRNKEK